CVSISSLPRGNEFCERTGASQISKFAVFSLRRTKPDGPTSRKLRGPVQQTLSTAKVAKRRHTHHSRARSDTNCRQHRLSCGCRRCRQCSEALHTDFSFLASASRF